MTITVMVMACGISILSDMLELVERKYFRNGCPVEFMIALSAKEFRVAGEIMIMSILQGGPAPNFLLPSTYSYISKESLCPDVNTDILSIANHSKQGHRTILQITNLLTCPQHSLR
jgi:hypothetical protein